MTNIIFLLVICHRGFAQKESPPYSCWLNCFEEAALFMKGMKNNSKLELF